MNISFFFVLEFSHFSITSIQLYLLLLTEDFIHVFW